MEKKTAFLIIGTSVNDYPYTLHPAVCQVREAAEILMGRLVLLDEFNRDFQDKMDKDVPPITHNGDAKRAEMAYIAKHYSAPDHLKDIEYLLLDKDRVFVMSHHNFEILEVPSY